MATMNGFVPGRFCWVELGTSDQAGAKAFYSGLFGWAPDDRPMGPDLVYTMLKHGGREAGALYGLQPDQKGVPPHWMIYVAVTSADDAARKAGSLGAKTIMAPYDVMDFGRTAVLEDPTGAHFSVWEARTHKGMQVVDEPGAFCWGELATKDPEKAAAFYTSLFGWGTKGDPKGPYTEWTHGGQSIGGMMPIGAEWGDTPSHWGAYFQVTDCDVAVAQAKGLGAKAMLEPKDIPGTGRFALLADPQGATFSVVTLTGPGH
jgi:uncharacterized protein